MFCGLPGAFVQIPPRETLSKKHYIPMIDLTILSATATIYVVAVEDSTVLIIKGDYHQLDSVSLTGDVYERTLEPDTIYEIEATKPVQVHLKISSTNWQSAIVIPPVDQYKENTVLFVNDTGLTIRSSSGVNESGANVTLPDNVETIPEKMFAVVFFEKTAGIINVVTNQQNYADINEFCEITLGSPGDKVDNDCDGLVDEEECATTITPGTIDVDIDGDINEDCADGTSAPPSSNILLNVEYSLTSCANGGGNGPGNEGSGDEGSGENTEDGTGSLISETMTTVTEYKDKQGPYIQDTEHIRTVAPIVLSPPIDFNTPTTTPAPGSTAAPAESCTVDCYCPCGWVEEPKDYTKAEIQTKVKEIQEKLTVSKDTLSATIRKKVSAKDDRASATTVGWAAVVWLGTMIGAIVLLDISSVVRDLKVLVNNLRQVF